MQDYPYLRLKVWMIWFLDAALLWSYSKYSTWMPNPFVHEIFFKKKATVRQPAVVFHFQFTRILPQFFSESAKAKSVEPFLFLVLHYEDWSKFLFGWHNMVKFRSWIKPYGRLKFLPAPNSVLYIILVRFLVRFKRMNLSNILGASSATSGLIFVRYRYSCTQKNTKRSSPFTNFFIYFMVLLVFSNLIYFLSFLISISNCLQFSSCAFRKDLVKWKRVPVTAWNWTHGSCLWIER